MKSGDAKQLGLKNLRYSRTIHITLLWDERKKRNGDPHFLRMDLNAPVCWGDVSSLVHWNDFPIHCAPPQYD